MNNKKKILVIVDWFAPGYKAGGPIQSCVNFAYALKNDFSVYVLTTDTDHGESEPYRDIPSNQWIANIDPDIHVYYAAKATLNTKQLRKIILEANADYVYLNHLFSPYFVLYPLWMKYKGALKSQVVLSPRGALYDSALAVKTYKKMPFIRLFRLMGIHRKIRFHATNTREKDAILHFFPGSEIVIADNLPDTNQPVLANVEKEKGSLKCIFIARIFPIKNLLYLLTVLEKLQANIHLTVVGPVEDKIYWEQCLEKIDRLPSNISAEYLGSMPNNQLNAVLVKHHLFVLPTTGENFGHSIFEALLAGRPVLISDQTPWLNLAEKKAGWDLPLNNPGQFGQVLEAAANWEQAGFNEWMAGAWNYARTFIQNPELKGQYLQLFSWKENR